MLAELELPGSGRGVTYKSTMMCRFFKGCTEMVWVVMSEDNAFVRMMLEDGAEEAVVENRRMLF